MKYKVTLKSVNEDGKEFKSDYIVCADDINTAKLKSQDYAAEGVFISSLSESFIKLVKH